MLTLVISLLTALAHAEIRETSRMSEVIKAVDTKTLLIFDLDNTVIEPTNQLGSDQWYYFLERKYREIDGLDGDQAYKKAMHVWNRTQDVIKMKPVENDVPKLLRQAQARGIKTIGLTARTLDVAATTLRQLASIDVDLSKGSIHKPDIEIRSKDLARYTGGILFVGDRNVKGEVLTQFLKLIKHEPKRIVFVDDKLKHVQSVEAAMKELKIPYIGFRYGAADEKVKALNDDMKDLKLFALGELETP